DEAGHLIGRSCVLEDLSALQQLRSRVATQEQLLAHISREAAEPILGVDRDGRLTSWNRAAEQLMGVYAGEALGRPLSDLAGDRETRALLEQVAREHAVRGVRMEWRGAHGDPVPVEVSAALLAGVGQGGVALVARDLSPQLQLERQLMRSEKLAVVGSLAAGLAHEIGTPLNVISATAEFLMPDVEEPQAERLREIVAETDRISRLVRELLTFARGSGAGRALVPVAQAVERVLSLLRIPIDRKRVRVEVDVPEALPHVMAEPDGLHQVLLNLIVNAVNAVAEGGRVAVSAREGGAEHTVVLAVDDDGPGVPEALRGRIFDPFFTTRPEGTGLGLAVCERIVSSLGGDIRVSSGAFGGARFTVQLPSSIEASP
ncbi:MAG TPA: ATP-binding protein, partial [Anaeromyxobacteraceae bacterium]